jgi:hypothetical protein
MSAKPKKPKLKNLPKRPKASASNAVWENYAKKCTEIQKQNRKSEADYKKAAKAFEAAKKAKAVLMEKTKGLGKV